MDSLATAKSNGAPKGLADELSTAQTQSKIAIDARVETKAMRDEALDNDNPATLDRLLTLKDDSQAEFTKAK